MIGDTERAAGRINTIDEDVCFIKIEIEYACIQQRCYKKPEGLFALNHVILIS